MSKPSFLRVLPQGIMVVLIYSLTLVFLYAMLVSTDNPDTVEKVTSLDAQASFVGDDKLASSFQNRPDAALPKYMKRVSEIQCKKLDATFMVTNLYFLDGNFHMFLGDKSLSDTGCSESRAVLGIGFGSSLAYFVDADNPQEGDAAKSLSQLDLSNSTKQVIFIFAHKQYPPVNLPEATQYHAEPVSFFCSLWENFFRTIYAGVGSWYTMMNYGVFYLLNHRFILVQPSPNDFIDILNEASAFEIERLENVKTPRLFKSAVWGISKDMHLAEIEVERDFGYRQALRSLAFRSFGETVGSRILFSSSSAANRNSLYSKGFERAFNKLMGSMGSRGNRRGDWSDSMAEVHAALSDMSRTSDNLKLTFVARNGNTRKLLNTDEMLQAISRRFPKIRIDIYAFETLSFRKQVKIIQETDILMSVHGAALAHVVFMRPNTFLVELFPYGFHKTIYQNLAKTMGVNYLYWQNSHEKSTIFYWDIVSSSRFTDRPMEQIVRNRVDWTNMDSKNYWRNQDTKASVPEILQIFDSLDDVYRSSNNVRYLLYMPWEQLSNQLLGLKSACATAIFLDRTLVIPYFGYRSDASYSKASKHFNPKDFVWSAFDRYFNSEILSERLPCKYISMDNFVSLNGARQIGQVFLHDFGSASDIADENQLKLYYSKMWNFKLDSFGKPVHKYYLSRKQILELYGSVDSRVLSVGAMFWMHDFGKGMPSMPLTTFNDYMFESDPLYREIQAALEPRYQIRDVAAEVIKELSYSLVSDSGKELVLVAIHVRRSDYADKCKELSKIAALYRICLSSDQDLSALIMQLFQQYEEESSDNLAVIYISTDGNINANSTTNSLSDIVLESTASDDDSADFSLLFSLIPREYHNRIIFNVHLTRLTVERMQLSTEIDTVDRALVDQWICVLSNVFYGNQWSSFSRHVYEWRMFAGADRSTSRWFT